MCKQFFVFCSMGLVNTIAALAVILVLSEALDVFYLYANILGYGFGFILSFTLHRNVTFKSMAGHQKIGVEFGKFFIVFIAAFSLQFMALIVMVKYLHFSELIAQFMAVGIYALLNFAGNRKITFRSNTAGSS